MIVKTPLNERLTNNARQRQFRSEMVQYLREPVEKLIRTLINTRVERLINEKMNAIDLNALTNRTFSPDRRRMLIAMIGDEFLLQLPERAGYEQ